MSATKAPPSPSSLRLNSPVLPILVGILFVMQLIEPFRGWIILLVGLGLTWLIGYTWARQLARNLTLKREMRFGWAQVGDQLEERFTLHNRSGLPALWVEVEDYSSLPDYHPGRATGVGGRSETNWRTTGTCTRRGLYTLGPTGLHTSDPFGIYAVTLHDPACVNLVVMPPIVALPAIEVAPGGRAGEGRPRPDAPERTVSASGVRAYAPGDNLRWIHWRTTARRAEPYVRLFDSTPSSDWWIVLDMDRRVQAGEGPASTEEHSVILAASLADRGLRMGRAVGLVAYGGELPGPADLNLAEAKSRLLRDSRRPSLRADKSGLHRLDSGLTWLSPREGNERRWEILRALALIHPGDCSLAELLARIRPSLGQSASLVIITPNAGEPGPVSGNKPGGWLEALLPLVWRGAVPTVLLLDQTSFGAPAGPQPYRTGLPEWNIPCYVIERDLLDRPAMRPGSAGQWEWRVLPTGRAVAVRRPRDLNWKALA